LKYQVGDKVLLEKDLDLLFNPYWKDKYRKSLLKTVTEADDKYFSIYKPNRYNSAIEEGLSCGANEYMIFYQESGNTRNWASRERLLHLVHDHEEIVKRIKSIGNKTFEEKDLGIKNDIKRLQESLQRNLEMYQKDMEINLALVNV
jgi:hypothetical protein